jgi:uncharacterized membrane protein
VFAEHELATWQIWLGILGVAIVSHSMGRMIVDGLSGFWKEVRSWQDFVIAIVGSIVVIALSGVYLHMVFAVCSLQFGLWMTVPLYVGLALLLLLRRYAFRRWEREREAFDNTRGGEEDGR